MNKVKSLHSIYNIAWKDSWQVFTLNFFLFTAIAFVCYTPWVIYQIFYSATPFYVIVLSIVGFLITAILQDKAFLDIVYDRKQNLLEYLVSLAQAFLMQLAVIVVWYAFLKNFSQTVHGLLNIKTMVLMVGLLFFMMRLQFASLYVLEKRCTILQSLHVSWLLTRHNNWLFEKFSLYQSSFLIVWFFFVTLYAPTLDSDFMMMPIIFMVGNFMRVRVFQELQQGNLHQ